MRAMESNLSSSVLSDKVAGIFSYLLQGKSYNSVSLLSGIMHMGKKICREISGLTMQYSLLKQMLLLDTNNTKHIFQMIISCTKGTKNYN